jgi:phosphoenolpyruvate carboxylase
MQKTKPKNTLKKLRGNYDLFKSRLQIIEEELSKCNNEMQQEYETQLQLLNQRGKLNQNEIKKLGELNAELFGHTNNRQKIKYVAQLKEENIILKKV